MFNIPPNKIKTVFIVSKEKEDSFLSFMFDLGQSWVERDFDFLFKKLEPHGVLLLRENDVRLSKVFQKLYDVVGVTYYTVGAEHLLGTSTVDPFIHNLFTTSKQWKEFEHCFKNQHGITFKQLLDIK